MHSRVEGAKGLKFQWKLPQNCKLLKLLEKWLTYKIRKFLMVFIFIFIFLTLFNPFSSGEIEKLDFWDANNSTNFRHRYVENHKYYVKEHASLCKAYWIFFKKFPLRAMFTLTVFEILLSKRWSVLSPAQWDTGRKRVKVSVKNKTTCSEFAEIAWKMIDLQD